MSIVPMRRLVLVGLYERKRTILHRLQTLGLVNVIERGVSIDEDRREHSELSTALEYLLSSPRHRRPQQPPIPPERSTLLSSIQINRQRREDILDHLSLLQHRRQALAPWGDFQFPPLDALGGLRLWFYLVPLGKRHAIDAIELPWTVVNRDHRQLYLAVVATQEPSADQVPFARSHTGGVSLTEVRAQEEALRIELEELDAERFFLTRWLTFLATQIADAANAAELNRVTRYCDDSESLFVLEAWVPSEHWAALSALCEIGDVALIDQPPEAQDEPPILLDNPEWLAGGEEAVKFFQLPGYRSSDPSVMIFFSFALFFAIILADAGYALIFALLCLLWRRRWTLTRTGRRLGRMGLAMSGTALIYGFLIGSYFGVTPPPDSLLAHLHWLDMDNFNAMMALSITIGVLHLMLANALAAWAARPRWLALANGGWILILGSGFTLWRVIQSSSPPPVIAALPLIGLAGGALLVVLFSSAEPFDGWRHGLRRLVSGVSSLGELAQAFGNTLSYMRLFALGLSSASLAITFNQLAIQVRDNLNGGGTLLFVIILLLGHILNFALALMGGVIHGLRLNLIEFLRWGVKGEGRPFKAFANKEKITWIK
ncbi:V-type ATP synthase subunit I [Salinicola sp. V024]|uniref:V-type ATP synthase subunit I n=1 Tax=Salinicola sp. V024 TaxID=3459609 RepID=UPI0040441C87